MPLAGSLFSRRIFVVEAVSCLDLVRLRMFALVFVHFLLQATGLLSHQALTMSSSRTHDLPRPLLFEKHAEVSATGTNAELVDGPTAQMLRLP